MKFKIIVTDALKNQTFKAIIKNQLNISNRLLSKLKRLQKIFVNEKIAFVNELAKEGDIIQISFDYEEDDDTLAQNDKKIDVLYEDDLFLAVDKPANMVVHPTSLHPNGTLANYVKGYLKNNRKIRPINRLDNGTSGIVLFAKNEYAQEIFKSLNPKKEYIAVVDGKLEKKEGTIDLPIARKSESIIERIVDFEKGQKAITDYKVIKEVNDYSVLGVFLETGRTHQIRVHLSYLGHPIVR